MCFEKQHVWWLFETHVASGEQIRDARPQEFKEYIPSPPHPVRQFFAYPGVNQKISATLNPPPIVEVQGHCTTTNPSAPGAGPHGPGQILLIRRKTRGRSVHR